MHERLLHYTPTTSKFEPSQSKFGKKPAFKKSSKNESSFSSNDSKDKSEVKCPVDGSGHRIWNCEKFKSMKIDERYNVAKEKNLCFCCLGDNHPAKDCPRKRKCGIEGCEKTRNKFLHYAKRPEKSQPATKTDGTNVTSNAESVRGLMQIARVRIFGRHGKFKDTLACCDTGSTQTWVDEDLPQKLDLKGETISLNVTGIHGTQVTSCQAVQATIGPANSMKKRSKSLTVHSQKNLEIGKIVYNVQEMKQTYPYLKCVGSKQIDLKKVTIILGQNAYELILPLEKQARRLQRIEERQEKAKKKTEIKQKRLQMEFERKQREHEEQMRQLDEKLQLRLLEAQLDSSTGEMSDKSRSSTESDSEERKPSKDSSKRLSDGGGKFAENMRVELPEEASRSFLRQKRPSFVNRLAEYRKRYECDEDYENPFEMETKVESTPIGRGERRYSPERSTYSSSYLPTGGRYSGYGLPPVTTHRGLPKLKLREFDGNPLDWPEWSGMFSATVDSSSINNDEKMSHMKTLLTGKVKRAVNGLGYSGAMYVEAWDTLQRKFGQPHHIVSSQLAKIQNFSQVRFNDLSALFEFADTVSTFVNIL